MKRSGRVDLPGLGLLCLGLLCVGLPAGGVPVSAQERVSVPVPVMGRTVDLVLADGERLSGELIEAGDDQILLWGSSGLRALDYTSLTRVQYERHGFGAGKAFTWVGLGALITGIGMTAACSQVEGTSCGEVFLGVTASWVLFGGLFAAGVASSQHEEVPANRAALRSLSRFPQGAPVTFVERNRSVARPPR